RHGAAVVMCGSCGCGDARLEMEAVAVAMTW
nr:hypothetical protein [Tanacetum cinerariifolium]